MKSALPIATVVLAILAVWYVAAALLNAPLQRDQFANAGRTDYSTQDLIAGSLNMERPKLPAPHQIVSELYKLVFATAPTSKRSLVYHGWITLQETLIGFIAGGALGVALAVMIVSVGWLERSMMPWIVASQTIPIIALAPMIVVILSQFNITGIAPKAAIAAYLCFFPITVGMVKGFRSPDPLHLDLMRTYSATRAQTFLKLRAPASGRAGRRHRRRSDEKRGRRHRRPAARRLLLWADGSDLGGVVRRRCDVGRAGRPHRLRGAGGRTAHGFLEMIARRLGPLVPPIVFGAAVLALWEAVVRIGGVPQVILPAPTAIMARFFSSLPTLWVDLVQTMKGVLAGYTIGSAAGLGVAILIDRSQFLQRGLLPIGNFVSALPIVGIAPIMVMWFGFDWPSKAAVVVVMTFFPMLVNTVAGLESAGAMERDLMNTYAADYWQTLLSLRLPAALPFIFNALKINTTLAMIGAIVAEFFGTPIVGMGFRISTEVGHLSIDMVWATIVVAALTGSLFYALVAGVERRVTFWHASYRAKEA
jgi:NitT/TauT family transport system permease protein